MQSDKYKRRVPRDRKPRRDVPPSGGRRVKPPPPLSCKPSPPPAPPPPPPPQDPEVARMKRNIQAGMDRMAVQMAQGVKNMSEAVRRVGVTVAQAAQAFSELGQNIPPPPSPPKGSPITCVKDKAPD